MLNFQLSQKDKYGLIIITISIVTRIFVVSIAWNYGAFLRALKENYKDSYFVELGWIAGLAQGMGALISPAYIFISKRIGYRLTFSCGLVMCFGSLLMSSFVPNEHYLFFTYSIPFGIGSSIVFVLGSVVTGLYYPPNTKYHISATVAVSLGFPLGFLILNTFTDTLMNLFKNDWQRVQLVYCVITLACVLGFCPFFTEKYAEYDEIESENIRHEIVFHSVPQRLEQPRFSYLLRILWTGGLLLNSCANNSVLIHLNGYFNSIGISASSSFLAIGFADAFTRIMLAIKGDIFRNNLIFCYIFSAIVGTTITILWSIQKVTNFNTIYCVFFGICPAVVMSLMYSVNSEMYGSKDIQKNYTINVMVSGVGIILGPILSGLILDKSSKNYESVFNMAYKFYLASIAFYGTLKYLLIKHSTKVDDHSPTDTYEELK